MTEIYDNFVERIPQTGDQIFEERLKRAAVRGLEVAEATQEEWDAAKHKFSLNYVRNVGD